MEEEILSVENLLNFVKAKVLNMRL